MQRIQRSLLGLLSPFAASGSTLGKQIKVYTEGLKTLDQLTEENARLKNQVQRLSAENQILQNYEIENDRLRRALDYRERADFRLIPATVTRRNSSLWHNSIEINRGSEQGISTDMPVITEDGVVGKTLNVGERSSTVLLISDETCKIAAKVEQSPEQGIVSGERVADKRRPLLRLDYLTKNAELRPGQRVYSSGAGGVFPGGLLIGTVRSLLVRSLDARAEILPAADLHTMENVFVVDTKGGS